MPVEIKELIIRAVVERAAGPASDGRNLPVMNEDKEAIVEACVKQVMRILRKAKER